MALAVLRELEWQPESDAKRHVVAMVKDVARQLGNTPAVCRKCYIHPAVLDAYLEGSMLDSLRARAETEMRDVAGLAPEEAAVLALLGERLAREDAHDRGRGAHAAA